jgi:hypothetical protein
MAARFNPAPGWPPAPTGWLPPEGWVPDPSWPAAPADWPLVVHDAMGFTDRSFGFRTTEPTYVATSIMPTAPRSPRGRLLQLLRGKGH